jgi:hypothetical protein
LSAIDFRFFITGRRKACDKKISTISPKEIQIPSYLAYKTKNNTHENI